MAQCRDLAGADAGRGQGPAPPPSPARPAGRHRAPHRPAPRTAPRAAPPGHAHGAARRALSGGGSMDGAAWRGVVAACVAASCCCWVLGAASPTAAPQDTCASCGFRRPDQPGQPGPGRPDGELLEAVKRHILSRLQMRERPNITHAVPKAAMVTALRKLHAGKVREDGRLEIPSMDGQASSGPPHDQLSEIISFAETGGQPQDPSLLPCSPLPPPPSVPLLPLPPGLMPLPRVPLLLLLLSPLGPAAFPVSPGSHCCSFPLSFAASSPCVPLHPPPLPPTTAPSPGSASHFSRVLLLLRPLGLAALSPLDLTASPSPGSLCCPVPWVPLLFHPLNLAASSPEFCCPFSPGSCCCPVSWRLLPFVPWISVLPHPMSPTAAPSPESCCPFSPGSCCCPFP